MRLSAFRDPLARGVLCGILFTAILLLTLPVRYDTNDDIGLLWALSGGDGQAPHALAPFNGFFLNALLFRLYGAAPQVPWWGLTLYASLTAAASLLFALLFRIGKPALAVLPALLYFMAIPFFHTGITSATLLLAVAGLLWLRHAARESPVSRFLPTPALALATVCLAAALAMRWQAALFFIAVFGLVILCAAPPRARRGVAIALTVVACLFLADRAASFAGTNAAEREFLRYNALRARFHDSPAGFYKPGVTERALQAAGWTREDYGFFLDWNVQDDSLFHAKSLERFLRVNASAWGPKDARTAAARAVHDFAVPQKNLLVLLFALLALAGLGLRRGGGGGDRWQRIKPWLLPSACAVALFFFAYHRFVERVYLPLFVLALVATLGSLLTYRMYRTHGTDGTADAPRDAHAGRSGGTSSALRSPLLLTAFLLQLAAVTFFMFWQLRELESGRTEARGIAACMEETTHAWGNAQAHSARTAPRSSTGTVLTYLHPSTGLRLENVHPLREAVSPSLPSLIPGGFWIQSPRWRAALDSLGFRNGRNFLRGAVENPRIGWMLLESDGAEAEKMLKAWEDYYGRNLGISMRLIRTGACPVSPRDTLAFYRMVATASSLPVRNSAPR